MPRPGKIVRINRPIFTKGYRETKSESLGSTAGTIAEYGMTIITATATGLVYQLPAPKQGLRKHIVVDYNGATGNLVLANPTTTDFILGTTANTITVSSSANVAIDLMGMSTAGWSANFASTAKVAFAGSTVTS